MAHREQHLLLRGDTVGTGIPSHLFPVLKLPLDIESVKGFLDPVEGKALYECAKSVCHLGPVLEIGSYCGKSTVYLGAACQESASVLFAVDHHRGSEEHQQGEEYHDPELFDETIELMDSFKIFRQTLQRAGLEEVVVPVVAPSSVASKAWQTGLAMVFIDGGHSLEAAMTDYHSWAGHVVTGGILAIHDIFPNPADGGQAPYEIYKLALSSGNFEEVEMVKTLAVLRRL